MPTSTTFAPALLACSLAAGSFGCAAGPETGSTANLTSSFDAGSVDGERRADGEVTATAKDANGDALLVLTVRDDRVEILPLGDRSLTPRTIVLPRDASNTTTTLEDWNFYAYAYSQHVVSVDASANTTGIRPQQRITGASCIAAGGTAMQCWYYIAFLM